MNVLNRSFIFISFLFLVVPFLHLNAQLRLDPGLMKGYDINLWPLFVYQGSEKGDRKKIDALFSLFRYSADSERAYRHSHLLPLYWYSKNKDVTDFRFVSGFYPSLFRTTLDSSRKYTDIKILELAPHVQLWQSAWSQDSFDNTYFLLIHHKKDAENESGHFIIFPLLWSSYAPKYDSFTLFPLYSWQRSEWSTKRSILLFYNEKKDLSRGSSSKSLFPLIWYNDNKKQRSFTFFPILHLTRPKTASGSGSTTFFPLYHHKWSSYSDTKSLLFLWWDTKYSNNVRRISILFPVLWLFKLDKDLHSYTLFPLVSVGSTGSFRYKIITPFYWEFEEKDDPSSCNGNCFFPFYGRAQYESNGHFRMIFPMLWSYSRPKRSEYGSDVRAKGMFPLFWYFSKKWETSEERFTTIFPLVWSGKRNDASHFVLFPLIWKFSDQDSWKFSLFPLVWIGRTPDEKYFTLLPLYKYRRSTRDYELTVPLLFHSSYKVENNEKKMMVTPLLWMSSQYDKELRSTSKNLTFFPLFSKGWTVNKSSSFIWISPVFYHSYRKSSAAELSDTRKTFILPLWYSSSSPSYKAKTLAPLFSFGTSPYKDRSHLMITPLFWKTKEVESSRTILFPLYAGLDHSDGTRKRSVLFPLIQTVRKDDNRQFHLLKPIIKHEKDVDLTYFRIAPLVWYKNSPQKTYFGLMPIYYYSRKPDQTFHSVLWQVYTHERIEGIRRSDDILWKLVNSDRYDNGDHEFRLLQWLFYDVNREGTKKNGFFPLYTWKKSENGEKDFSCIAYFYNQHKKKIPGYEDFYEEVNIFWFIKILSNRKHIIETYGKDVLKKNR